MLRIITITGETPETAEFSPATFILGEGLDGLHVATYTPIMGYTDRPDLTLEAVEKHLAAMREDGFTVTVIHERD